MSESSQRRPRIWAVVILGIALILAALLLSTGPTTAPDEKSAGVPIVRTVPLTPTTQSVAVTAYGPVIPSRQVIVKPQVSGAIIRQHEALVPGGFVHKGEELVGIDPADYKLDLAEKETLLEDALFELEVEQGRQVVAEREWALLEKDMSGEQVNRSLVLRKPHLRRTEARIRAATNEIAQAELALARTSVLAPFNAMVLEESVEPGQLVQQGSEIATLVGTDEFWVRATLPMADLRRIRLPGPDRTGAAALIYLDTGNGEPVSWQGEVVRLLSDLEPTGRMARVLIRVKDPLGLSGQSSKLPLLLGNYVRAEVDAGSLENVLVIPRSALREGQQIWVVDPESTLHIRKADILWTRPEAVLIANVIQPGEQLVISGLRTALPGMKVSSQPATAAEPEPVQPGNGASGELSASSIP